MKITHNKVGQNLNLSDANKADKANSAKGSAAATDPLAALAGNKGSGDASSVS